MYSFRRGFPPLIPGAPMVGPHMGPFMHGVKPGLPGFGGPFGPNVYPRPGYMPPGAAGGNYDPGGHYTDQELHDAVHHIDQSQHDANEKAEALAEAQGLQTNEIGRYLHQLGSVMDKNRAEQSHELATLHDDIGRIRDALNHPPPPLPAKSPTRVIVSDPPVQVTMHPTPQQMPAAVMNITEQSESGESPITGTAGPIETAKDHQQDAMLRELQDKVAELARRLAESDRHHQQPIEKIVIKETEYNPHDPESSKPLPPQPPIGLGPPVSFSPRAPSELGTQHVHFGPEHVKETTTEVIRGPAGQDFETEVVREYDRSASEVAAGLPPSHETIIETKTTHDIAGPSHHDRSSLPFRETPTIDGTNLPHAATVEEEILYNPAGSRYPASHAPPSTAAPSVIHLKDANGRPVTIAGDAPSRTAPPTVLGVSDLHNRPPTVFGDRPGILVEDHPNGLLIKPVPSQTARPTIDRENPVHLSNIPTQLSQPPAVHDMPGSFVSPTPTVGHADPSVPQSRPASVHRTTAFADPYHGTAALADPVERHKIPSEDGRSFQNGAVGDNKLRKPPPSVRFQDQAEKKHANIPSSSQGDQMGSGHADEPHASDMANVPVEHQPAGSSAPLHDASSGPVPHGTQVADRQGRKLKPSRDRPSSKQGSFVPAVLSTPPLLGEYNVPPSISPPSGVEEFGNMPVSSDPHHQKTGAGSKADSHEDAPLGGGRPNVLKKKPSKAQTSVKQHVPTGVQGEQDEGSHADVNITLDNSDGKHVYAEEDPLGRPVPPSIRKGNPAADHQQASRAGTLNPPGETIHHDHAVPGSTKADRPSASPEQLLTENERLATQAKAKAEQAEHERVERENIQREKEHLAKISADRHQEQIDALADLKKVIADHHRKDDDWKMTYADAAKDRETRRKEKITREKFWQSAFDKLLAEVETDKKWRDAQGKKPGADAVIDFLKKSNEDQTAFLRALASDIMAQNADQHKGTKEAAKAMAREQVAFNVAGYLDDFSKALSSEVRTLLKEVGDLRETRRALY
ncbi:hypothetical protein QFC19_008752 [Naganishia cerealis]|uniref:Uncharacterized protein n=1 Tax=Naganishia cerealis TaxID=610337 RepID=A0ACC2UZ10_9TREE|nr:hypothetical protein QFC19_008752 [Naganishia cerealis]